jgi:CHAD domain-containing protein
MSVSVTEIETKYELPGDAELPSFTSLPQVSGTSKAPLQELEADYYDTADLRLIRAGITLRRRRGGEDAGWHLKLPQAADSRLEIRLPLGRTGARVPRELSELVRVHTRGMALGPVARLVTVRQLTILLGESGESLAEVAADDVQATVPGESARPSRWHELEVELTGGDRELLTAADELLRGSGLRRAGRSAKLERALDGRLPGRPPTPRPLTASTPAGDVVVAYLGRQIRALTSLDPMVRRDEPDAVHQMRVASRRLRSSLRGFRGVLRRSAVADVADELKWLAAVLGEARDAEVLEQHLHASLAALPAGQVLGPVDARVQAHFAPLRAGARTGLLSALDSRRYFLLLDELDGLLADPPLRPHAARPAAAVLPGEVRRAAARTDRRMRHALHAPAGRDRDMALHAARKAAKQARYDAEAVTPALGRHASRFATRMKRLQAILGDHQDAVIAQQTERELGLAAHQAGENAFTYGLLFEREICGNDQLLDRADRAWRKASKARYRAWME